MLEIYIILVALVLQVLSGGSGFHAFQFQQHGNIIKVDRAEIASYNKNYFEYAKATTFKYNRTCPLMNLTFSPTVELGNDMELVVQAYKFLSNVYRPFPIHFQINACDAIKENAIGTAALVNCGNFRGCPLRKGIKYKICNFAPDPSKFPPLIPTGEYKVELRGMHHNTEIGVFNFYGTISAPLPKPKN